MPDFTERPPLRLAIREGAQGVPISWTFAPCSNASENDGSIPYATTIGSAAVAIYDPDGADMTSRMVVDDSVAVSVSGLVVTAEINYPAAIPYDAGPPEVAAEDEGQQGVYQAVVTLTLSDGAVIPYVCRRLLVIGVP